MSKANDVTILYVPLRKHIKQFFLKEHGGETHIIGGLATQVVPVRGNTMFGQLVLLCTEKTPFRFTPKRDANRKDMLALKLPARMKHYTMSDSQREQLTDLLEKMFREKLYDHIRSQGAVTGSDWAAIRCFQEVYELDTECFDPHKYYKLWRDRKNTITFDNRATTTEWYQKNRIAPDAQRDYSRSTEPLTEAAA